MLSIQQKQRLVKKVEPFTHKNGKLYKMGQDNKLWRSLTTTKTQMVMKDLHEEPLGGYFAFEIIKRRLLDVGYWWPTMYRDVHDYCKSCDACQRIGGLAT